MLKQQMNWMFAATGITIDASKNISTTSIGRMQIRMQYWLCASAASVSNENEKAMNGNQCLTMLVAL
jgi:hypothetical protein